MIVHNDEQPVGEAHASLTERGSDQCEADQPDSGAVPNGLQAAVAEEDTNDQSETDQTVVSAELKPRELQAAIVLAQEYAAHGNASKAARVLETVRYLGLDPAERAEILAEAHEARADYLRWSTKRANSASLQDRMFIGPVAQQYAREAEQEMEIAQSLRRYAAEHRRIAADRAHSSPAPIEQPL